MRCPDLIETWHDLSTWFDRRGILVLPRLSAHGPLVRLDAEVDQARSATSAEIERITHLLRAVVEHFGVRAVYVHQSGGGIAEPSFGEAGKESPNGADRGPGVVTVRVMAGGVVHELKLFAAWYADFLDRTVGVDYAARP